MKNYFCRSIIKVVGGIPRPQLNITVQAFATTVNQALNITLSPPFDPYANAINFLLASYLIPYVGLVGYVGTIPNLVSSNNRDVRTLISLLNRSKMEKSNVNPGFLPFYFLSYLVELIICGKDFIFSVLI